MLGAVQAAGGSWLAKTRAWLARAKAWLGTPEGQWFAALLGVTVLVRLGFTELFWVAPDLQAYETWGEALIHHPLHPYSFVVTTSSYIWLSPTYPPLLIYLYGVVDFLYFGSAHLLGLHVSHSAVPPVFRPILTTPGILTDVAQVSIIYALARTRLSPRLALLIAATYALSPAIIIDDAGWGQSDNIALLISVGALLLAYRHRGAWTGVLLGLAVLLKPEPLIIVPLALAYLYRWAGLRQALRGVAALAGTALVGWAPYLLPPRPEILVWRSAAAFLVQGQQAVATKNGQNIWWILGAQHVDANAPYLGPFSPQVIGVSLFCLIMLLAILGIWRDASPGQLWASAALISIGFYVVGTLQYERYIFPSVGFFLLAALYERRYWVVYGLVSLSAFVSLGATMFTAGNGPGFSIHGVHLLGRILAFPPTLMGAAVINVVCLLLAGWLVLTPLLPRGERERDREAGERSAPLRGSQVTA